MIKGDGSNQHNLTQSNFVVDNRRSLVSSQGDDSTVIMAQPWKPLCTVAPIRPDRIQQDLNRNRHQNTSQGLRKSVAVTGGGGGNLDYQNLNDRFSKLMKVSQDMGSNYSGAPGSGSYQSRIKHAPKSKLHMRT